MEKSTGVFKIIEGDVMDIKHEGVESIQKALFFGHIKNEIKLKPNYAFRCSVTQVQYCEGDEIESLVDDIVYNNEAIEYD